VSRVTIHRKGCHGGELRLVSRQFLWCVMASGRFAVLDPVSCPGLPLTMTMLAKNGRRGRKDEGRKKEEAGAGLKESRGIRHEATLGGPPSA